MQIYKTTTFGHIPVSLNLDRRIRWNVRDTIEIEDLAGPIWQQIVTERGQIFANLTYNECIVYVDNIVALRAFVFDFLGTSESFDYRQ